MYGCAEIIASHGIPPLKTGFKVDTTIILVVRVVGQVRTRVGRTSGGTYA